MAKTKRTSRADGTLSPEEFSKAIEEYKARRAQMASAKDAEDAPVKKEPVQEAPAENVAVEETVTEAVVPEKVEQDAEEPAMVKEETVEAVEQKPEVPAVQEETKTIAQMDEDMSILFDIIDTLLAEREFKKEQPQEQPQQPQAQGDSDTSKLPFDKMSNLKGDEEEEVPDSLPEEDLVEDAEEEEEVVEESLVEDAEEEEQQPDLMVPAKEPTKMNADSVDAIVRQRIQIGIIGDRLNLDGLENMPIRDAKMTIIHAVRPTVRLDGKSATYVNAMFDLACAEIRNSKGTAYQKNQMFNKKNRMDSNENKDSATNARQRMINRFNKKED